MSNGPMSLDLTTSLYKCIMLAVHTVDHRRVSKGMHPLMVSCNKVKVCATVIDKGIVNLLLGVEKRVLQG
jgi:hypothetical protein